MVFLGHNDDKLGDTVIKATKNKTKTKKKEKKQEYQRESEARKKGFFFERHPARHELRQNEERKRRKIKNCMKIKRTISHNKTNAR